MDKKKLTHDEDKFHYLEFMPICRLQFSFGTEMWFREGVSVHVPDLVLQHDTLGIVIEIQYEHDRQVAFQQIVGGQYCKVF